MEKCDLTAQWEEEFRTWWEEQFPLFLLIKPDYWEGKEVKLSKEAYLQACKVRQEEIDRRIIEAVDKLHEAEIEIERLKKYEVRWWKLKDQLRRDREQGHLQKTARAWLLMQEFEEAK